jgi:hypothetical protein
MILRSPTEHENGELGHAGMDGRHPGVQDASETSMSAWIPALHAGMTESRSHTKNDRGPPPFLFSKEIIKATKSSDILIINFVVFGPFVVRSVGQSSNLSSARFAILDLPSSILDPRSLF